MKKMIVAATLACAVFSASIVSAQDAKMKAAKESPKTEKATEKKPVSATNAKVADKKAATEAKASDKANTEKTAPASKKMTEAKK